MINKNLIFITLIVSTVLSLQGFIVYAEMTQSDIQNAIINQDKLNSLKNSINNVSENFPSILKNNVLGSNRVYHIEIEDCDIGVIVEKGKIKEIWPGKPESPTHYINTTYEDILKIANSENSITAAAQAIVKGEIKIMKAGSSSGFLSNILLRWIIGIVAGVIIVLALIIFLIVKVVRRKKRTAATKG